MMPSKLPCQTSRQLGAKARLLLMLLLTPLIPATLRPAHAVPLIFNASETAQPGDIVYCQGSWGTNATFRYQLITGAATPSYVAATTLPNVNALSQASSPTTQGLAYIAAKIPSTAARGLYAVWVTDATGNSAPRYINRAHPVQAECPALAPAFPFRVFGRNLMMTGFTPTVRFSDEASPFTSLNATVTTTGSDANILNVTAPTTLTVGHTYNLIVNNGSAGASGDCAVEPDNPSLQGVKVQWAQETVTPATTLPTGTVPWNLAVPWQADYLAFCNAVYNAKTTYGATGNGTTNDAPAIQAAIDAAAAAGGGVVYLPAGTYRIDYYAGHTGSYQGIVDLKSKVVLMGDGAGSSVIQFGYEAVPASTSNIAIKRSNLTTTGLINLKLDNMETATVGTYLVRPTDGWGGEFFIKGCTINAQTAQAIGMTGGQYGLVANSIITCTGQMPYHTCFNGEYNVTFRNNTFTFNTGKDSSGGVHDFIYDTNHMTRSATSAPTYQTDFVDMSGDKVVFINNTFDVGNTATDIAHNNDGEVILTEASGGNSRTHGTVTSATATTLSDASQSFASLSPNPTTGPGFNANAYAVAIVSGPGTGQWRYVTSNTATQVTVDRAWDVVPASGSNYVIAQWTANQWLVKNNLFQNNHRGIVYHASMVDCVTVGNTLTNDQGIGWTAAQAFNTTGSTYWVFRLQWTQQAYGNTVGVDPSIAPGTPAVWPSLFQVFEDLITENTASDPIFGTGVLGFEARGNSLEAHTTDPNTVNLMDGSGFLGEQYENMLVDENHWPRYAPADSTNVGILGSIFQNNTAKNQVALYVNPYTHTAMSSGAYWIGTGVYGTVISDPVNVNVGAEVYDQLGGIPGQTLASLPSGFSVLNYQCEDGSLSGSMTSVGADGYASGGNYVGGLYSTGSSCTLSNVDGGAGGTVTLTITYATPTSGSLHLYVNGTPVTGIIFPATGGWYGSFSCWQTVSVAVPVNANTVNTIKLQRDAGDTAINIDKITLQAQAVSAGAASSLTFGQQPSPASTGATLTPAVTVQATDAYGSPVSGANVSLALTSGGTLSGTPSQTTDSSGTATFPDLSVAAAGTYTLTATLSGSGLSATSIAFTITAPDTTAPTTTASLSGTAGTNDWNTSPVQVTLSATDNAGGSGVVATFYMLDGGAQQNYSAQFTVTGDGTHTVTYWSVDTSGNTEAAHTLTVNIDATPPTLTFGTPAPAANAAGWNNSAVTLPYTVSDATSGVASASPGSPLSFATEGANLTQTATATDNAGNSATFPSPAVSIDETAPTTMAIANGATITLAAADNLSGIAATFYTLDNGAQQTYVGTPFSLSGAGSHTVSYYSTDVAGNSESEHTLNLTINAVPALMSLSPASAAAGTAAFTLTINGTGFASGSVVNWNGTALATTFVSATQLTATVPASLVASVGTVPVTVTTPAPGGGTSGSKTFTIKAVTLASLSLAPASVVGSASSTGMVKLTGPAPAGGMTLSLSSNSTVASVPASVMVTAAQTTATFPISTTSVAASTAARITASVPGQSRTATLTVKPANAPRLLNCGGGAISPFTADASYNGGSGASTSHAIDTSGTSSPAPAAVYQSQRRGTFTYTLSGLLPGAGYTLRLHFTEFQYFAAGKRVFSVSVNGSPALTDFDIFAAAGNKAYKAVVQQISVTANGNGQVMVSFTRGAAGAPAINGIELH